MRVQYVVLLYLSRYREVILVCPQSIQVLQYLLFCVPILSLQVFIRDAEYVDSVTASQITFVSSQDLGVCILTNFIYSSSLIDHFTSV